MNRRRSRPGAPARMIILIALAALAIPASGCNQDEINEFRAASADELGSGIQSILSGVITGLIEIYKPDDDSTDTTSRSTRGF